jgi:hypothetical protein
MGLARFRQTDDYHQIPRNSTKFGSAGFRPFLGKVTMVDGLARSPSGGIQVRATERGLPIALKLDRGELSKTPTQLAQEIFLLCQVTAKRAQVARRRDLVARGVDSVVIRGLNLSTEEELADAQERLDDQYADSAPDSWMKPV